MLPVYSPHVQLPPPIGSVLFRNFDLFAFSWRQLNFDEVNEECDSERFVKLWKYAKIIVLIWKVSQKTCAKRRELHAIYGKVSS